MNMRLSVFPLASTLCLALACGKSEPGGSSGSGGTNSMTDTGGTNSGTGGDSSGSGGSASGSGGAGTDTGGAASGGSGGMGTGGGGPAPGTFPLLVATTASGLAVWENADGVPDGSAPDFEVAVPGSAFGVVASSARIAVTSSDGVFLYDDLDTLSASSMPAATIANSAFEEVSGGGVTQPFSASSVELLDTQGDLWLNYGTGRAALFKGFDTLDSSSEPDAEFAHEWGQVFSMTYDSMHDTLFGPQVSGAGVVYFEAAKTRTGTVSQDGALDDHTGWASTFLSGSLFVTGSSGTAVWHNVDVTAGAAEPDATFLTSGLYIDGAADAIAFEDSGELTYFESATSLTNASVPLTLTLPESNIQGIDLSSDAQKVFVAATSGVYAVVRDGAGLTLRATLPLDSPALDVVLVE